MNATDLSSFTDLINDLCLDDNGGSSSDRKEDDDEEPAGKETELALVLEPEPEPNRKKKLIVLGLGGLLVYRVYWYAENRISQSHSFRCPDGIAGNFLVFKRPFCDDFLRFCFERFEVALWSSSRRDNVMSVLHAMGGDYEDRFLFIWCQEECTNTGFKNIENRDKPLYLKELKKIWEKEWPNGDQYSSSNTLLIDEEPCKALRNPLHTGIFPIPFKADNVNDTFLAPKNRMMRILEGLATTDEDIPSYLKQHKIGQPDIGPSHPHWNYYRKVVNPPLPKVAHYRKVFNPPPPKVVHYRKAVNSPPPKNVYYRKVVKPPPPNAVNPPPPNVVNPPPPNVVNLPPPNVDNPPPPNVVNPPPLNVDNPPPPNVDNPPPPNVDNAPPPSVDNAPPPSVDNAPPPSVDNAPPPSVDNPPPPSVDNPPPPSVDNPPTPSVDNPPPPSVDNPPPPSFDNPPPPSVDNPPPNGQSKQVKQSLEGKK